MCVNMCNGNMKFGRSMFSQEFDNPRTRLTPFSAAATAA